jgi:hypothetical protein
MLLNQVLLVLVTVGMVSVAVGASTQGEYVEAAAFAGTAALVGTAVLGPIAARMRQRLPTRSVSTYTTGSEAGVRVRYSALNFAWAFALLTTLAVSATGILAVMALDGEPIRNPRDQYVLLIAIIVVPCSGWLLGAMIRGSIARGRIVLTRSGVHHRYLFLDEFVPWDAVMSVRAERRSGPVIVLDCPPGVKRRLTGPLRLIVRRFLNPFEIEIPARALACNPAAVLYALRYYHHRPDDRSELATGAAVERLRNGELAYPPQVFT